MNDDFGQLQKAHGRCSSLQGSGSLDFQGAQGIVPIRKEMKRRRKRSQDLNISTVELRVSTDRCCLEGDYH